MTAPAHHSLPVSTHSSFLHTHSLLPIPDLVFLLTHPHTHTHSLLCVFMMPERCNTSSTSILSPSAGLQTRGQRIIDASAGQEVRAPQRSPSRSPTAVNYQDRSLTPIKAPNSCRTNFLLSGWREGRGMSRGRRESVSDVVRGQEPPISAKFKWDSGAGGALPDPGLRYRKQTWKETHNCCPAENEQG